MFDHGLYDQVRTKYSAVGAFPELYDKVKPVRYFRLKSCTSGNLTNYSVSLDFRRRGFLKIVMKMISFENYLFQTWSITLWGGLF